MKFGQYKELDEALNTWFRQQRELDHSVSSCTPRESQTLFEQLHPEYTAAKKRASFKQDVSFIIYNKNKCLTYHNIEHKDNY